MSTLFSHFFAKNNEIRPQEADFTEVLESIAVKPKMLYFYGKLPENRLKSGRKKATERPKVIAIVGTRKPTKYGENIAYELAYEAARRGAVVVSGLAYGIDSVAHRAALDAGGVTVAVLGTPIDQIYPRPHLPLAAEIIEKGGCVMSELPPGVKIGDEYLVRKCVNSEYYVSGVKDDEHSSNDWPQRETDSGRMYHSLNQQNQLLDNEKQDFANGEYLTKVKYHPKTCFLQRNRIISGLSDVVVIPEAAKRSGSLNTAMHALEQGKDIFAVPGDITRPLSGGCNRLIQQGAMPYLEPKDVLDLLFPPERKKKSMQARLPIGDNNIETQILQLLAKGVRDGEEILKQCGMGVQEFNRAITFLEIKGSVKSLGANNWMLA